MQCFIHSIVFALVLPTQSGSGAPSEIQAANSYRARIATARIEWTLTLPQDEEPCYYTSKLAGSDDLQISRGLADGRAHLEAREGEPFSFSEFRLLLKDGEQWSYDEGSAAARIVDDRSRFNVYRDMRELGFEPTPASSSVDRWYRTPPDSYENADWSSGRAVVIAHWTDQLDVRWTLDPDYAMQPVETVVLRDGEVVGGCVCSYKQFDGVWFPEVVVFRHKGNETARVTVLDVEANQAHLPQELTPNDLGLIPGIQILHASRGQMAWTGTDLIGLRDWLDLAREGKVDLSKWEALVTESNSPTGAGRVPRQKSGVYFDLPPQLVRAPGLWEDYTRRFIRFCDLDIDQTRKAWATLKECQKPAYARLPAIHKEAKELEEELASLRGGSDSHAPAPDRTGRAANPKPADAADASPAPSSPSPVPSSPSPVPSTPSSAPHGQAMPSSALPAPSKPGGEESGVTNQTPTANPSSSPAAEDAPFKAARIKALDERLAEIYKPIETIFEKELKPGLNKLLTPEQKARVEKHDAEVRAARPK